MSTNLDNFSDARPVWIADGSGNQITSFGGTGAVTIADGANVTQGAVADTAWSGSGSGSLIAILKALWARIIPGSTSTARLLSATASTNSNLVKNSGGTVRQVSGYNASSSARYLKLYDKSTAPTVGTDTPRKTIYLLPLSAFIFDVSDIYANGIGFAITGVAADADTTAITAGDILCLNVDYI